MILLLSSIFILSCSSDNSQPNNQANNIPVAEGSVLRSYKQDEISNFSEHFFENNGSRYEKILRADGTRFIQYIYNQNNKMMQIVVAPDDITFNGKTIFYYNNSGEIIKMEKDRRFPGTTGELKTWLFSNNGNTITQEYVSDQDPNYNHERVRYIFDNDGLLISRHEYSDSPNNTDIFTVRYITLTYDSNKNVIALKQTLGNTHDLPDSPTNNMQTLSISYEYDNKVNPLRVVYMNHYKNYLFSDEFPFNLQRGSFQDRVLGTGTNNLIKTIYPINTQLGGIPVDNVFKNEFIYQDNNLPKKMGRISTEDNIEYSKITFNYQTQ